MADKNIGALPSAASLDDDSLLVAEQQGQAVSVSGALFKKFARDSVSQYVNSAKGYAESAEQSASQAADSLSQIGDSVTQAAASATAASESAASAQTAQGAAEAAQTAAEQAKADAESAKADVESAKTAAEAAKTAAEAAAAQAEQDKEAAETAQNAAQAAKTGAETAKTEAETASNTAAQKAEEAAESADGAAEARAAIENMLVEAVTLATGQPATVNKELVDGAVKLVFGLPSGEKGEKGDTGTSIQSIDRTAGNGAPGTTDTYTITTTDGSTFNFYVYNGMDGTGSGDMKASVYDPQGKHEDIFAYADQKYTALLARIEALEAQMEKAYLVLPEGE